MTEPFLSSSWYRIAGLKPKLRAHAQIHRHRYWNNAWYVLQDHATGRAHRFTPAAYAFIGNMDGKRTVDEIWTAIAEQLDENAPTQDEIIQLMAQLHAVDMLQLDTRPDANELFDRFSKQRRSILKRNLRNPLSMTFPLWDPDHFLGRWLGLLRPAMGRWGVVLWLVVVVPAIFTALLYWKDLTENIADRVLTAQGLVLIALIFPIVKLVHELAHAFVAKTMGGEVHEMGIMFLVFYPIPYVDASASSVLQSKWQRAAVGAAGMAAELFLASLAFYFWLSVEPGLLRACAYDVILIAGASTILINGNPLLRFDGYYILCDLSEMPNLAQRSTRYWGYLIERHIFGAERSYPPLTPGERKWLVFFAPASLCYRLLVLCGIAIFIATEFFVVGVAIAIWAIIATVIIPLTRSFHHLLTGSSLRNRRVRAAVIAGTAIAAVIVGFLLVPFPLHTVSEGVIWLPESAWVRAGTDGFVERVVATPGAQVNFGEELFVSNDPLLEKQTDVDRHRVEELELDLAAKRFNDRVEAEIIRNELAREQGNLDRDLQKKGKLVARSGGVGTFIVPRAEDLPGRFFHEGDTLGYVTPASTRTVRVVVSQDDIDLVRNRIRLIEARIPDRINVRYAAVIVREVPAANDQLPSKALAAGGGGHVASDPKDTSGAKSLQRWFQVDLNLEPDLADVGFGSRVYVRFEHEWEPLGFQFYRRLRQLFLARFYV
jgi:putative peptide zinc metalloprotease protein